MNDLYSFERLWRAYRDCRYHKRNTLNALAFEIDAEARLLDLQAQLRDHSYRPGPSICFVTDGPKPREVFAADFRDRIVHHLLVEQLERRLEPGFIHDSYACRKGKGVLAASDRLMEFLRRGTANGRRRLYALKLDVASFFPSIDKPILWRILQRRVANPELRWLCETILTHDPTADYHFKRGPRRVPPPMSGGYPVPAVKSLFGSDNRRGLPIGNLTSQFWANVYLNELDQFAKRQLGCRFYLRYVDDIVLLHEDAECLRRWRAQIVEMLAGQLNLRLRDPQAEPRSVARGCDFVGWKTYWSHRLPRRRTLAKWDGRLTAFASQSVRPMWAGLAQRVDVSTAEGRLRPGLEQLRATAASYSGHLRYGSSRRAWETVLASHPWMQELFRETPHRLWRLQLRWPARVAARQRFGPRYGAMLARAGERSLIFWENGRFVEFYGPQRERAAGALRLLQVRLERDWYAFAVGFPRRLRSLYIGRAMRAGHAVVDVRRRRVVAVWMPREIRLEPTEWAPAPNGHPPPCGASPPRAQV